MINNYYDDNCHSCAESRNYKGYKKRYCIKHNKVVREYDKCGNWIDAQLIQCLECGKYLRKLSVHISLCHHTDADEYKEKHGLNRTRGLVSQSTHNISSQWAYNRIVNGEVKPFDCDTTYKPNLKGITRREECKQHLRNTMKGRVFSEEHKANMSKSATGRILDEETRRKISDYRKGKATRKGIPMTD